MKEIKLTDGYIAIVDDEDYELLSKIKWTAAKDKTGNVYAMATVHIHRLVKGTEPGKVIDHIDGDTLNNTKENLEFVTTQINSLRRKKFSKNKTGYRGVQEYRGVRGTTYRAMIGSNKKCHCLGTFATKEEAGAAYDTAAIKFFGHEASKSKIENWASPKRIPKEKLLQVLQEAGVL